MPAEGGPTKEKLLASIRPGMELDRGFFMKVYGYAISSPGFAETALLELEISGECCGAWDYYAQFVGGYEKQRAEMMKGVARWYRKQDFDNRKGDTKRIGRRRDYKFNGFPEDW